jgi:FkbM family methyltransferase
VLDRWTARARQTAKSVVVRPGTHRGHLLGAELRLDGRDERRYVLASRAQAKHRTLRHELWQVTLLSWLLQPGNAFLDIGANVGLFSANIARFRSIDPTLRVVAFEPNPPVRSRLLSSGAADQIEVRAHALGEGEAHTATLFLQVGSGKSSLEEGSAASSLGSTEVEVKPLGPILEEIGADVTGMVLKIDVEGHELSVLRGAGDRLSPEHGVHSLLLDDFARDDEEAITGLFRDRGYRLFDARTLEPYRAGDYSLLATTVGMPPSP